MGEVLWVVSAIVFTALVVGSGLYTALIWDQDPDARRGRWLRRLHVAPHRV